MVHFAICPFAQQCSKPDILKYLLGNEQLSICWKKTTSQDLLPSNCPQGGQAEQGSANVEGNLISQGMFIRVSSMGIS